MSNLSGKKIRGYELLELLDEGGFGAVYRAHQPSVRREVAIKIILPVHANSPEFIRRFETEAHLVARLEHPHITPLYDFWRDPDGAYIVMRYLRGGSLKDVLKQGALSLDRAMPMLHQIATALNVAHSHQVIHRDIKPGNILLDEDGNAYLTDFGIAKSPDIQTQTNNDQIAGTIPYVPPEQLQGGAITPQSDIYSLGIVLYEMLAGEHPFKDASISQLIYKQLEEPLPNITDLILDLSDDINDIIQKATEKTPEDRYPDVLAMSTAFRQALGTDKTQAEMPIIEQLSLREHEILQLIADRLTNREIAENLFLTVSTIKWHIKRIYRKLGVRTRVQAIVRAREMDLIVTDDNGQPPIEFEDIAVDLPVFDNPYKGLHAFQSIDEQDFFGREEIVTKLINRMTETGRFARFMAIVGPSGSGKSSLVNAGLIPAIWKGHLPGSERWLMVQMVPGTRPMDELEIALTKVATSHIDILQEHLARDEHGLLRASTLILPNDDTELVLVVDQFEELFTLVEDEAVRAHFLSLLWSAVTDKRSRVRVIITLRADYYDRPLYYPEIGEMVRSRIETVLPLHITGLERAIAGPAERVEVAFEPGLVAQITSEMQDQAGALPLLQFALTELFDLREGRMLTHTAYKKIGGAVGALTSRADELFESLPDEGQHLARQMFLRMVTLGEGAEDTRRRVTRSELESLTPNADLLDDIIEVFAEYRLIALDHDYTTREPTLEVAHEALLQSWDYLREWIRDGRDDLRVQRQVAVDASRWIDAGRDESYLATGAKLAQYDGWLDDTNLSLTTDEAGFLIASVEQRQAVEKQKEARKERESEQVKRELDLQRQANTASNRARRGLQLLVAVLLIAVVGALGLSGEANAARATSDANALEADTARSTSDANAEEAVNARATSEIRADENYSTYLTFRANQVLDDNPLIALALAVEANQVDDPLVDAQNVLYRAAISSMIRMRLPGNFGNINAIEYTSDGRFAVSHSHDDKIVFWNTMTWEQVWRKEAMSSVLSLAISPDNKIIAAGTSGGFEIVAVDPDQSITSLERNRSFGVIRDVAFSPDGQLLAIATSQGAVVWDLALGEATRQFDDQRIAYSVAFHPNGQSLLVGAEAGDNNLVLWSLSSGRSVRNYTGLGGDVQAIAISPDGNWIAAGDSVSNDAQLWNTTDGSALDCFCVGAGFNIDADGVKAVEFHPDSRQIVVSNGSDAPALWRISASNHLSFGHYIWPERTERFISPKFSSLAFSPDGNQLLADTYGIQNNIFAIDMINAVGLQPVRRVTPHEIGGAPGRLVAISPNSDGHNLILGTHDTIGMLSSTSQFLSISRMSPPLAVSPDGRTVLTTTAPRDTLLVLNDITTGDEIQGFEGHTFPIIDAAFSPDGQVVAAGSDISELFVWDIASGDIIRRFRTSDGGEFDALTFSPDGQYLLAGVGGGTIGNDVILWNVETGEQLQIFGGHNDGVGNVAFSPDGRTIASGSNDQRIMLWDTQSGDLLHTLTAHRSGIRHLEFSPDGQYLVSLAAENDMIIWDAILGRPVGGKFSPLINVDDEVDLQQITGVAFDPVGHLVTSESGGLITYWEITPNDSDWLTWTLNNRFVPELNCELRQDYNIEPRCDERGRFPTSTPYPTPIASPTAMTVVENVKAPFNTPVLPNEVTIVADLDPGIQCWIIQTPDGEPEASRDDDQLAYITVLGESSAWTYANLSLLTGQTYIISVSGLVQFGDNSDTIVGPDGNVGNGASSNAPAPELTDIELVGRIGDGEPFSVGTGGEFVAGRKGRLQFIVNDDGFDDNCGAFDMVIEVLDE